MVKNNKLKIAFLEKFPNQRAAAAATGIEYSRLSTILHGHRKPNAKDQIGLRRVLGKQFREFFPEA